MPDLGMTGVHPMWGLVYMHSQNAQLNLVAPRSGVAEVMRARRASRNLASPRVTVVVPTRNEASNLPLVFGRLPADVRVVEQQGKGKGDALAQGFAHASGDIIVTLDADGSADPAEIPRFVSTLVAGADFAKGSRCLHGGGSADITRIRWLGNKVLCAVANRAYHARFTDLCYGYNAFWTDCLDHLSSAWPWFGAGESEPEFGTGFEVETVINVRSVKGGLVVWEVPSFECRRLHGSSNLHAVRDGLRIVHTLWRESPGRSARVARLQGSPPGMHDGLLPVPGDAAEPVTNTAPWTPIIPAQVRTELGPFVAVPPEGSSTSAERVLVVDAPLSAQQNGTAAAERNGRAS
jgi:hypothetical protein